MSNYKRTWDDVKRENPAAVSSMKMLLERFENARCDSPAVSTCVRCNIVFLARWTADLLETSRVLSNAATEPTDTIERAAWIAKGNGTEIAPGIFVDDATLRALKSESNTAMTEHKGEVK